MHKVVATPFQKSDWRLWNSRVHGKGSMYRVHASLTVFSLDKTSAKRGGSQFQLPYEASRDSNMSQISGDTSRLLGKDGHCLSVSQHVNDSLALWARLRWDLCIGSSRHFRYLLWAFQSPLPCPHSCTESTECLKRSAAMQLQIWKTLLDCFALALHLLRTCFAL